MSLVWLSGSSDLFESCTCFQCISSFDQGGQPCGFYPQKVEICGNEKRMWKCGKFVEISGKSRNWKFGEENIE